MIVLKREFKSNFKGLIIWSLSMCAILLLLLSIYPQMAKQEENLAKLMEAYPEGLRKAFGMDALDLSTVLGFYGVEAFVMLTLLGGIYAAILASGMLSKEENDHTAEFLLAKPITRMQIVTEKLLAVLINVLLFNVAATIATIIGFQFADSQIDMGTFYLLAIGAFLLHFTFAAISFMLSSLFTKSRKILALSLGIVIVTYFLSIAAGLSDKLEVLKYFTPFEYVKATEVITNRELDLFSFGLMVGIIIASLAFTYAFYHNKDMNV